MFQNSDSQKFHPDYLSYQNQEMRDQEVIEGVHTPRFISDLPAIDPDGALELALTLLPMQIAGMPRRNREDPESLRYWGARLGLKYCRNHQLTLEEAFVLAEQEPQVQLTQLELFDLFAHRDEYQTQLLIQQEQQRRTKRDKDILQLEIDLLARRGIPTPQFANLLEYCAWIPEWSGYNKWAKDNHAAIQTGDVIYWDMMEHYAQILHNSQYNSFNPQNEWQQYIEGTLDITDINSWSLQNMGNEDVTYLAMAQRWHQPAKARQTPHINKHYTGKLLTHTTSYNQAQNILESSFLFPKVCYSVNLVIVPNPLDEKITLLFDREEIESNYSVFPYIESGSSHEQEVRSNEKTALGFCIGMVPQSQRVFTEIEHYGQGTRSLGRAMVEKWDQQYQETGQLWTNTELENLRSIAQKASKETQH